MQKQGVQVEEGTERERGGGEDYRAVGEGDSETVEPQSVSENDCVKHLSLNSTPFSLPPIHLYLSTSLYPLYIPLSIPLSPSHFAFLNSAHSIITCLLFTSPNELRFGTLPP